MWHNCCTGWQNYNWVLLYVVLTGTIALQGLDWPTCLARHRLEHTNLYSVVKLCISSTILLNSAILNAGSLPSAWAEAGAFPSLSTILLYGLSLSGALPPSWANSMALPSLTWLTLGLSPISGTLPVEWGSTAAFQNLEQLSIFDTHIAGARTEQLQAVHKSILAAHLS